MSIYNSDSQKTVDKEDDITAILKHLMLLQSNIALLVSY